MHRYLDCTGCAGFTADKDLVDVGATTLVDFDEDGIGGQFLAAAGIESLDADRLPGYVAWLPDRRITLPRDPAAWRPMAPRRWATVPCTANSGGSWTSWPKFSRAARRGARLPIRGPLTPFALSSRRTRATPLGAYLRWTIADLLRACGLRNDQPLVALLSMLIEDTVHGAINSAPLINAALGITIRGAGLTRARGGMRGFWMTLLRRYRAIGGQFRASCAVDESKAERIDLSFTRLPDRSRPDRSSPQFRRTSSRASRRHPFASGWRFTCGATRRRWVARLPSVWACPNGKSPADFHPSSTDARLRSSAGQWKQHVHLGLRRTISDAPAGWRSVVISTHCELAPWENLSAAEYAKKNATPVIGSSPWLAASIRTLRCRRWLSKRQRH